MSEQITEILDFNKLEDRFFCIDVLTRARFSIRSSETELAADIDRILASLTAISQNPPETMEMKPRVKVEEKATSDITGKEKSTSDITDIEKSAREILGIEESASDTNGKEKSASDNDDIVDLLTGNKIR